MGKHIQVREVGVEIHSKAKARAALKGMTLSEYVKTLIENDLRRASWAEFREKLENSPHPKVDLGNQAVEYIREMRETR